MSSDFLDAHQRHLEDADLLFDNQRWANADHLYGLAAECGLKRLMLCFGMQFDSAKDVPKEREDKVHVDGAWDRYETYRNNHHQGAGYPLPTTNPFANWRVSERYEPRGNFSEARVKPHRKGAEAVMKLIRKAELEGVL
jgi:hypothetical protein